MRKIILFILMAFILAACAAPTEEPPNWDDYNPFAAADQQAAIPLSSLLPPTRAAGEPISTPTPSLARFVPASEQGPGFKIIPDSELVKGPAGLLLNMEIYLKSKNGYIKAYQEEVDGELLSGIEIVELVSQNYSVNPRLLLALIEYQSRWVTNPVVDEISYPMRYYNEWNAGLYRQLTWTANELNRGYYLWRANALTEWTFVDGDVVGINPSINAGTAALQHYFALLYSRDIWEHDITENGFFATYQSLFGYPFDYAIEPIVPANLTQPQLTLPFARGETWSYTGGPHGGWDVGSGWAALDFAAPGEPTGCAPADAWVRAAAAGIVVRANDGAVVVDLDGDGYEETGWTLLYMHMGSDGRVSAGSKINIGDRIGHPSCEGGLSNASHLHFARRYNGEWIPADGRLPFNLDGWVSSGTGSDYDGYLTRGDEIVEAWDGQNPLNQITR
ncbi:MAG: peptidoglycan DD-metalloendopeptidase family protein [Anaerolineae bacterium]|jgi:LasA protease|nr:peptidoglycan DD-metalloendopeptidase family protein [Anaerolineae bacterium]MBT7070144.1 peptidoglycan DD-metalloendopeptidase family protein [Anaerolineae bacterium]MBT7326194.1 peptidoglycan DD-metalloendopeptidase family protein [Anaerolineae bacterium]